MSAGRGDLGAACRATADAASGAIDWFKANPETVRQEANSLNREFRKFRETARRLHAAVQRPMCVGVFGPSQAGKSYLISALARPGTKPLIAEFDGVPDGVDFVRHINPEGGQESTGLVTRFSIKPLPSPAGHPVNLRLLSQADLVKILGNTFFSDADLSEENVPTAPDIQAVFDSLRPVASGQPAAGLCEEDVFDIQEYFERQFKGEPIVKALSTAGFWDDAAALAPRLDAGGRARLFATIWNGIETFTLLYELLVEALAKLGDAGEAFCQLDGLVDVTADGIVRRRDSIIDVKTLNGIARDGGAPLSVTAANGRPVTLPRALVTALVAEVRITMRERPWPFFEHTDLLDFPGARSREHIPDIRRFLKGDDALEGLFLRGKVAYLFERYCAEQELTSMLLCLAPSNQEVRTLPLIVKDWIDTTHGPDPATRAKTETALFLVLTKFDSEFAEAAGQSESSQARWTTRLNTSLLDFFGKVHSWPQEWRPGAPFDNTFFLRNPNFKAKHILDYDTAGLEAGLRASEVARIARYREEYLSNETVRRHVRQADQAWDEAFRLNDGGITYLAKALGPVCNPSIKSGQIATRLDAQRQTMRERLQRYFVSDDVSEQRTKRGAAARQIVRHLARCAANQRFGRLLRLFQLSDSDLMDVFYKLETQGERTYGTLVDADDILEGLGIAPSEENGPVRSDTADLYAAAALDYWIGSIRSAADNLRLAQFFGVPEAPFSEFVDELIAGAARLDLESSLAARLRPALSARDAFSRTLAKPALIAADGISAFVMYLGFDGRPAAERPASASGRGIPIFAPRDVGTAPRLSEQPARFDQAFYSDWFKGFLAFVDENAMSLKGRHVNLEQNAALGQLLDKLAA